MALTEEQKRVIEQANALKKKLGTDVTNLGKSAIELGAINPSLIKRAEGETATEFLERKKATEALARTNAMADNPLLNKAVKPTDAPEGKYYSWIGGTDTGQWQLYDIPGYQPKGVITGNGTQVAGTKVSGNNANTSLTFTASDGKEFTDQQAYVAYQANLGKEKSERQSAYDLLYSEFDKYGLGSLVTPLKELIVSGASPSEFTIRLRETDAYKKRFAANEKRVKNGLRALSEAEYIRNEDNYQEVMRRRGLPPEYYAKGDLGVQKGFDALLAGDVSATELEDRIVTAQDRVLNANPEVAQALKAFYPGISNGDILAYTLDPANAINAIKRKITAAEIGGAAVRSGLTTSGEDAAYLERYGVTKAQAEQGYQTISQVLPRASELSAIYQQDPYTQATAEQEVFNLPGQAEAQRQRKKLTELETSAFSGKAGVGAIARDRAGGF